MKKNKTGKYFKYAIGEIILVMIGILLALQVNSYYQFKQDRKLEYSLLKELQASIRNDSLKIDSNIKNFEKIKKQSLYLDSMIKNKCSYKPKIDSAFGAISAFSVSEANYIPFDKIKELKNGIIRNDSLFNSLSSFYNSSKFLAELDRYFQNGAYFRQEIYPKYFKGYRYGTVAVVSNYQRILDSDEIKIAIDYCLNDAGYYLNRSKNRAEHAGELIDLIFQELKLFN